MDNDPASLQLVLYRKQPNQDRAWEYCEGRTPDSTALRRCDHCKVEQKKDIRLSRCAGCVTAMYCSKECQKADWKHHRLKCSVKGPRASSKEKRDAEAQSIGFSSCRRYDIAFDDFTRAHADTIIALATLYVAQHGGIDWSQKPLKMLELHFKSSVTLGSTRNPESGFELKGHHFIVLRDYFRCHPFTKVDWDETEPTRKGLREHFAADPTFRSLLPVRLVVEGSDISRMIFVPQFASPGTSRDDEMDKDKLMYAALVSDLLELYKGSINLGFPLQHVENVNPLVVLPGRYQRKDGNWTWHPFFKSWLDYKKGIHRGLDRTMERLFIGSPPDEMMVVFWSG